MLYHNEEIAFDSSKILQAILKAYGLKGSPECNLTSEIIDMMVAAACEDPTAQESWEQHCIRLDEKLNREQALKSITNLLTSIMGRKHVKDYSPTKAQIDSIELRKNQLSRRQSECDGKASELAAMMPIPPMIFVWKGEQNACTIGV